MIEKWLCDGAHAYGSLQDTACAYIYAGTLTDILAIAVLLLTAACWVLAKAAQRT
jgi:hypothetical protein